jgi:hypothetical protein
MPICVSKQIVRSMLINRVTHNLYHPSLTACTFYIVKKSISSAGVIG